MNFKQADLNGQVTFMIDGDGTTIELADADAGVLICNIELTPEQLSEALSRLGHVPVKYKLFRNGLRVAGRKMEVKDFSIEMRVNVKTTVFGNKLRERAQKELKKRCPKGWTPDLELRSQHSFEGNIITGKVRVNTHIRRWVKIKQKEKTK